MIWRSQQAHAGGATDITGKSAPQAQAESASGQQRFRSDFTGTC